LASGTHTVADFIAGTELKNESILIYEK